MTELTLNDIQGNLLRGYRYPFVAHSFGELVPGDERGLSLWRRFFEELRVTFASDLQHGKPRFATNVGLSYRAISALVPSVATELSRFEPFYEGMPKRSPDLGDNPAAFQSDVWSRRDIWISLHAETTLDLAEAKKGLVSLAGQLGLADELRGAAIVDQAGHWQEHFGFRDDISFPAFEGMPGLSTEETKGRGKLVAGTWQPLAPGEFVLGQTDELGQNALSGLTAEAQRLLTNGTFAAFRHLWQHVGAFRKFGQRHSSAGVDVAEKMMGRKRNGDPLIEVAAGASEAAKLTDFTYGDDPTGAKCPLGSHVRRVNPRGADGRHRIIRRGMPFGSVLGQNEEETESDKRGLLFVVFNADIADQFEFVQKNWCNGKLPNNLADARDPIGSAHPKRAMMIEGDVTNGRLPQPLLDIPNFVTCLGGQYYLYPGRSGLALLGSEPA